MNPSLWLIALLLTKHFFADFPLQVPYMLGTPDRPGKGGPFPAFVAPLLAHSAVHVLFTLLILVFFAPVQVAAALALAEGAVHFVIDRIKAAPSLGGRFVPAQRQFWAALGADQLAHGLTYIALAAAVS